MCVICVGLDAKARPTEGQLYTAAENNPDGGGWGLVYRSAKDGKRRLRFGHSMNHHEVITGYLDALDSLGDAVLGHLCHFRIATHGAVNLNGCHPFRVTGERTLLAHNGILPVTISKKDSRSDSRVFAEDTFPYLGGSDALASIHGWDVLDGFVSGSGSKVVLLAADSTNEPVTILGEELGHWTKDTKVWWSGYSYAYQPPTNWKTITTPGVAKSAADSYEVFEAARAGGTLTDLDVVNCLNPNCKATVFWTTDTCRVCDWCQNCDESKENCLCRIAQ